MDSKYSIGVRVVKVVRLRLEKRDLFSFFACMCALFPYYFSSLMSSFGTRRYFFFIMAFFWILFELSFENRIMETTDIVNVGHYFFVMSIQQKWGFAARLLQ